jgi:(E)-4-hydroxy-3-methylbut-2-enyl-diphosphate synthase
MDENARSPDPQPPQQIMYRAILLSALGSARRAEEIGLAPEQIILSCKMSGVQDLISVYRALARRSDYPLHLGLTEAGMGTKGTLTSTSALAVLLPEGICDHPRSLTPQPGEARRRSSSPSRSCSRSGARSARQHRVPVAGGRRARPGARETDRRLPARADAGLEGALSGVETMKVAVMGCIVRGPGEQARGYRHQPAGHRRSAGSAGLHRRREAVTLRGDNIAGVPRAGGALHREALRPVTTT